MAYANQEDVEKILSEEDKPIPAEAEDRLAVNLEEATDQVISFLGREYTGELIDDVPDDVPGAVRRVTARVALRGFTDAPDNPGAEAETQLMGPFSHTLNWSKEAVARDIYLTDPDRARIRRFQVASERGVYHAPMVGAGGQECPWWQ